MGPFSPAPPVIPRWERFQGNRGFRIKKRFRKKPGGVVSHPVGPYLNGIGASLLEEPGYPLTILGGQALAVFNTDNLANLNAVNTDRYREVSPQAFLYFPYDSYLKTSPVFQGAAIDVPAPVPER